MVQKHYVAPQTALALLSNYTVPPQGRITLLTGVPVLTTAAASVATVFYTPATGVLVPIYDGSRFTARVFSELSNVLANAATGNAGPAAGAASKNYDLFIWDNAGTLTLTRGAAWNSDTVRSAATENDLQMVTGVLTNLNAITNGPGVNKGTYVGTIRTDAGGATVSWSLGVAAGGGGAATLNVWNMYNRRQVTATVQDTTTSWTYTSATVQAFDANSAGNRASFVRGLNEDSVDATLATRVGVAAAVNGFTFIGLGLDVTNAYTAQSQAILLNALAAGDTSGTIAAKYGALPGLGFHFLSANNSGDGTNLSTIYGNLYMNFTLTTQF